MENKKRSELFIMTTFLCIFVVCIHLTSMPVNSLRMGSVLHKLFFLMNKSLSFVVPGFIFLSGLKLAYSYRNKDFDFSSFMRKRFSKILIPYLIWYVLYYISFIYLGLIESKTLIEHIKSILLGDLVSPFYFITIIMQFYLIFGVILYLFKRFNHNIILAVTFIAEFFYLQFTYINYEDRFFFTYILYFVFGAYVALNLNELQIKLRKNRIGISICFFVLLFWHIFHAYNSAVFGTPYMYWRVIGAVFSFVSICAFYEWSMEIDALINERLRSLFRAIDAGSYHIFLTHCLFIYFCNEVWARIGLASITGRFLLNSALLFLVVFPLCCLYPLFKFNKGMKLKIKI